MAAFETIGPSEKKYENKDDEWCILTAFDKQLKLQRKKWKQGRLIVHSEVIRNYLEPQWKYIENKDNKWCILTLFETILNCREKRKQKTLSGTFWRYLNRFGTAVIILTQGRFRVHYWTHSETIFDCHEKKQHMIWHN